MSEQVKQPKLLKGVFREFMKGVCTSVPGHILAFDPVTQLSQVQVGISRVDVNGSVFTIAPIIETPVYMPGGSDFFLEYEIEPMAEGVILFSQRCIDMWLENGGVANNPIGRFHNMQDAMFFPGMRSIPGAITGFANDGVRLRNKAGTQFVWLKADGTCLIDNGKASSEVFPDGSVQIKNGAGHIRLGADGTVNINGVTFSPAGLVTSPVDVIAAGISLTTHKQSGVTAGQGVSGVPVP